MRGSLVCPVAVELLSVIVHGAGKLLGTMQVTIGKASHECCAAALDENEIVAAIASIATVA
jgi:hypothetical protein